MFNGRYNSGGALIGGATVGSIESLSGLLGISGLVPPLSGSALSSLQSVSGGRTKSIFKYTHVSTNTQTNSNNPASTGTLEGVQRETVIGTSTTIQNTSNNNSSYSNTDDIFTKIDLKFEVRPGGPGSA